MKQTIYLTLSLVFLFITSASAAELNLFAGAGLRQPVDRLVRDFERKTGHRVNVDYDGGGRLLARITASGRGDLFMPGSSFFLEKLHAQGRVHSWRPIVAHIPVVAVNKLQAQRVTKFEDLAAPGLRFAMGDPKAVAIGKTSMIILERASIKEQVLSNAVVYGATVKQLALYVAEGNVDASIIWRSDAFQFKDRVNIIPVPDEYNEMEMVPVGVLKTANDVEAAVELQDFLSSEDAIKVFETFGFLPLQ